MPADLLDPAANDGRTLLYYTGLRRLAKNILHEVVGRYLDSDNGAMETLRQLQEFPPLMAEALSPKDAERFGRLIDVAWRLNVDLDPHHSTSVIEALRARVTPRVWGAKLLGAGGGGFLLLVCRSAEDAAAVQDARSAAAERERTVLRLLRQPHRPRRHRLLSRRGNYRSDAALVRYNSAT